MPLTSTSPQKIIFSRIRKDIKVTVTDDLIVTPGVKFSQRIEFINAPTAEGLQFKIEFREEIVDMHSMDAPITETGLKYRTKSGAETLAQWLTHFAEDTGFNYLIASNFDIVADATGITFTGKVAGPSLEITFDNIPGTEGVDYTLDAATAGVDEETAENYGVYMELWFDVDDKVQFDMFRLNEIAEDADAIYSAQINKILHSRINSPFPSGTEAGELIELADGDIVKKYWFRFFQYYGDPPTAKKYYLNTNSGNYYYAMLGGNYIGDGNTWLATYGLSIIKFLTWQKRIKYVTALQPEFLYWFIGYASSWVGNITLKIYYDDDTTDTETFAWTSGNKVMYIPCGYQQLVRYSADEEKTVVKWTIKINPLDDVGPPFDTGETFTFILIEDKTPWLQYYTLRNSFGAYDTMRNAGSRTKGIDITGEILSKYLPDDYVKNEGEFFNSEFENRTIYTVNLQHTEEKVLMDYVAEWLVHPRACIALPTVSDDWPDYTEVNFIPIIINPQSIEIYEEDGMLFSLKFDYKEAFANNGLNETIS